MRTRNLLGALAALVVFSSPWIRGEDPWTTAERNGRQAAEAFEASQRVMDAWLSRRDPVTGLLPRVVPFDDAAIAQTPDPNWVVKDSAADLYPFLVIGSRFLNGPLYRGTMHELLRREVLITTRLDRLPDDFQAGGRGFVRPQIELTPLLFGASEYAKDGLLPITEILGETPWYHRLVGLAQDIMKHAPHRFNGRKLPADSCEVNGNLLQVLSRLYSKTGNDEFLQGLLGIADFYLLEMLPKTGYLPVDRWDFAKQAPVAPRFRMSDHGNEIVGGLAEAVAVAAFARPDKAAEYRPAFFRMIDRLLEVGRNEDGVFQHMLDTATGKLVVARPVACWGYMYNAVYAAYQLGGGEKYRDAVAQALRVLADKPQYLYNEKPPVDHWRSNAYSDAVESVLVILNRLPDPRVAGQVDAATAKMRRQIQSDGLVEGWYGDGNTIRTLLMYALWKSVGAFVEPWARGLRLGAVQTDGSVQLVLSADSAWSGVIRFDAPRHRQHFGLRMNYPRLNEWPEWFVVEADRRYSVTVGAEPAMARIGAELQQGLPVQLAAGASIRITVRDDGVPPYGADSFLPKP